MSIQWRMCLICVALAALVLPAHASGRSAPDWGRQADLHFSHFDMERGLPHTVAMVTAQDRQGFIWVGTQNGLARWDGYRFQVYRNVRDDPYSLPSNLILSLLVDRAGQLWVGTASTGLARYLPERDGFERIPVGAGGTGDVEINAMTEDGQGYLWVGTHAGLDRIDPVRKQFVHFQNDGRPGSLAGGQVKALLANRDGTLWVGTDLGLSQYQPHSQQFTAMTCSGGTPVCGAIGALHQDSGGTLWAALDDSGLARIDAQARLVTRSNDAVRAALRGTVIVSIADIGDGKLWLGTAGGGVIEFATASGEVRKIVHDGATQASLSADRVHHLLRDRNGNVWIGTSAGLNYFHAGQTALMTLFGKGEHSTLLSGRNPKSLATDQQGRIWLGDVGAGVTVIAPGQGRIAQFSADPANPDEALPNRSVWSVAIDRDGLAWIGTDVGLYRIDLARRQVRRIPLPQDNPYPRINQVVMAGHSMWLGTMNGLLRFDPRNGKLSRLNADAGPSALTDVRARVIHPGADGRWWIGTYNGLNLYDSSSGTVERIGADPDYAQGLSGGYIAHLANDDAGKLWVATLGGGISILEGRDSKGTMRFSRLGVEQGLPSQNIGAMHLDKQGRRMWVSTSEGLATVDTVSRKVRHFGRADGAVIRSYWVSSVTEASNGTILFGGLGGVTVVDTSHVTARQQQMPLAITAVRIDGQALPSMPFNGPAPGPLVMPAGARGVQVEFATLDYASLNSTRYQYRLDGFDTDWIDTDASRRLAAYNNLAPGHYTLQLRSPGGAAHALALRVLPAWYQTLWFRLLALAAAAAALVAVWRARTALLRRRQLALERMVRQRTLELHQKQQALEAANASMGEANAALAQSADTLHLLGEVGREITANLDLDTVFDAVHRHIDKLLYAPSQCIYRLDPVSGLLERVYGMEDGQPLGPRSVALDTRNNPTAEAARERREVLFLRDAHSPVPSEPGTRVMHTNLFGPLIVGQRLLGVMTIQSDLHDAFGERERGIFRTLCAYTAIALANAQAWSTLQQAQHQLVQQEKMAALGQLIASIAHEINSPIGAIKSSGSNMAEALKGALPKLVDTLRGLSHSEVALFVDLLDRAASTAQANTREQRERTRAVERELASLGVAADRHLAQLLVQLKAHDAVARLLPLLNHRDSRAIFDTAQELASVLDNLGNIAHAVERVAKIVYALKSYSHMEQQSDMQWADLRDGVETVLALYQSQIRHGTTLVRQYEALPPLQCRPADLKQVWTNLIHNALQAMDYRGTLTIGLARRGNEAVVSIGDVGSGISEAIRDRIFEPFFTTKPTGEGSGLGLDTVRRIVACHGGRIDVHSVVGQGTTMSVILPITERQAA